jgi:mRNA-degrading endonuclease toxin of MazEF toxin-antitoxin module
MTTDAPRRMALPAAKPRLSFDGEITNFPDGLDWKTMVRCDKIHLLPKARFDEKKGNVTEERRYLIARKMVEVLRLPIHRR